MSLEFQKEFRDPVHGYISVPVNLCRYFIDTPIFQRLRDIEQTSMRSLYPSAHHDRFAHSLGVYYLANLAFHHLIQNTDNEILQGVNLLDYKPAFLLAALMHDCGHAPFSHTFEDYYNIEQKAKKLLFKYTDEKFIDDYNKKSDLMWDPAAHEQFSAAMFLFHYSAAVREVHPEGAPPIDRILVARMITGCTHENVAPTAKQQVENCLISLINGPIDVDKLDYIVRDTWASGINNVSIDIHRLLSAVKLVQYRGGLRLAFRKSAHSVLQSVVDGRNYLYRWVYSHHTVVYYDRLLKTCVKELGKVLSPRRSPDSFMRTVFSEKPFEKVVKAGKVFVYMPSDSDLHSLLRRHVEDIPRAEELISRQPTLVPLWKTYAEFEHIFKECSVVEDRPRIMRDCKEILSSIIGDAGLCKRIESYEPPLKYVTIKPNVILLDLEPDPVSLTDVDSTLNNPPDLRGFFYVFVPRECQNLISACRVALSNG